MFYKFIRDGYIIGIGIGAGDEEISETEYNTILDTIYTKPRAQEGYYYALRNNLEWELKEKTNSERDKSINVIENEI